jgi:pyruvate dehydrogenase E2 component (dihydrolipoamide acetyltransferase)
MLVHGFASQAATWENIGPALAEQGFDVFAPDLAGHGRSTLEVNQFDSIVESLVAAIIALAPRRNIHLVGHSMGAAACVFASARMPNQIAQISLLAPAGLGSAIDHEFISAIASVSNSETLRPLLDKLTSRPIKYTAKQLDAMAADLGQGRLKDLAQALIKDGHQALDIRGALSTLRCPVNVLFGVEDQIIPWTQIAALEPSVAVHLFREAGHMIHVDEPLALVKLLAGGAFPSAS